MEFGEDNKKPKNNKTLDGESKFRSLDRGLYKPVNPDEENELIEEWKALGAEVDYTVPPAIVAEVQNYLNKMKDPSLEREEWTKLVDWMREMEEKDLNYRLARYELTKDTELHVNKEVTKHEINELKRKLAGKSST